MDEAAVERWLSQYVEAWRSGDPHGIGELFTEDAVYRYHPWDEPTPSQERGREAIVASWIEHQDPPGSWTAEYRPWLVDGDRAVVTGTTRYLADDRSTVESEFHNVFFLEFDEDGQCRAFAEVYMKRPD
jgi:uncharacterized protein (TIGR02246 family)